MKTLNRVTVRAVLAYRPISLPKIAQGAVAFRVTLSYASVNT